MSNFLWPHGLQHTTPPWPSPTPGAYSNSCPLSQWYHPTISSSIIPFSSRPQSFPASGSFQTSQLFTSGGQSTGASASISVLPMNTQDWSPLGWTGWISLQSKGLSRVFSNNTVQKHQFFNTQLSYSLTLTSIHDYWKMPRSKRLLISWLWSPSAVILEPKKIKSLIISIVSPSICREVMGPDAMILVFKSISFLALGLLLLL